MNLLLMICALQTSTLTIDKGDVQGIWEGWGTSLCWMGKMFGDREDVADLLFTTKTIRINGESLPGLGFTIVRYNAGACSWNQVEGRRMAVSPNIPDFRQMEGFWLDPNQPDPESKGWDWSVDASQRAMLLKAKARGANRFELFSNSPMWWMCTNDNPSGATKATDDNLRKDRVTDFVKYLAAIAKRAKDRWGFRFTSIEPFNEPLTNYWSATSKQEGCAFSLLLQREVLRALRTQLDLNGLRSLPIAASDETSITQALKAQNGYDAATRLVVGQLNVHGYEGENSPRTAYRAAIGDRPLWVSEHGEGDPSGQALAKNLALDFHDLRPSAWCYWQPLDGGGWGCLVIDPAKRKLLFSNPKFFVLAQYTRHIRPGMLILRSGDPQSVVAFDPKHRKLVLVSANFTDSPVERTYRLQGFLQAETSAAEWISSFSGAQRYILQPPLRTQNQAVQATIPAKSVVTIELTAR